MTSPTTKPIVATATVLLVITAIFTAGFCWNHPRSTAEPSRPARDPELVAKIELADEIGRDRRHPSMADLSGVWKPSLPTLVGMTVQLDQEGNTLTGRGYHWGCIGIYDLIDVEGTVGKSEVQLRFSSKQRPTELHRYHLYESAGHLTLQRIVESCECPNTLAPRYAVRPGLEDPPTTD